MAETRARDTADINATVALKANIASPTFTGTPAAPTAAAGTNTTQLATTEFANAAGGLVHIATQTFSAASSVSVNNCFSATYENYLFIINQTASANGNINMRMRAAGTDATSANYFWQGLYASNTTVVGGRSTGQTSTQIGEHASSNTIYQVLVANPFTVAETRMRSCNAPYQTFYDIAAGFVLTTSFDGFTIFPSTGTISGTIRVYGYKNS